MYVYSQPIFGRIARARLTSLLAFVIAASWMATLTAEEYSNASYEFAAPNIIRHVSRQSERLEMTSNASRILTLDMAIPRVQVNNPELVAVTPLSATQIQVSAKKPGVTQINLWDAENKVHTLDVIIYGDVRELEFALKTQFPNSSVAVKKFSQSLMLTGFVDSPDHVGPIMRLAEDYAPKVINNLDVGGVQQVLLKVKVFEVSRTKLRQLGVDWAALGSSGDFVVSSVSGIIGDSFTTPIDVVSGNGATFSFGVTNNGSEFFTFIDALQQQNVAKILAEPNMVSVSGRPAQFLEGGEVAIQVPQGLGVTAIEYKPFGTQVDFLPIVLGNGNIRLEVRPRVSEPDQTLGTTLGTTTVPGFRVRQADTAVEMKAGQTFALAGLIQQRTEAVQRGLPYISDVPILGVPFRRVEERVNEIELLIMVTPEFIDAMDPHEVPQCGPGMSSMSPDNCSLYFGGHLEVPNAYGPCGVGCDGGAGCDACNAGGHPMAPGINGTVPMTPGNAWGQPGDMPTTQGYEPVPATEPLHGELQMPTDEARTAPQGPRLRQAAAARAADGYNAQRMAQYRRAETTTAPPSVPSPTGSDYAGQGGLIGPVGYDVK